MTDYDKMRDQLSRMTVKQLRKIARDEGICLGYSGATKAGTVNEIVSQRRHREHERGES
ncbi:MAG: hypothetical protein IKP01_02115 [Bacteroidales bacterium]|nr:hypothetical protein [Bacteroidales bacterium]